MTPTLSPDLLAWMRAGDRPGGPAGVYLLPDHTHGVVVVAHQLPVGPATLWFRLLGRGAGQEQAMILEARGLVVKPAQRKQIVASQDLRQLEGWVRAAITVASVAALLSPPAPAPRRKAARVRT